ncbi:peptidoglycan-binding protein, partial [Methylobacterium oryzihabitans]
MPEAPARRDETERLAAEPRPAPRPRVVAPPARRPAPRSGAAPALPGLLHRAGAVLRHPAGVVGTLLGIGAVAAVATNALTFQSGRHPAPLFAKAPPAAGGAGKSTSGKSASDKSTSDRSAAGRSPPAAPAREAAAAPGETARAAKPAPDGIGDLIRGDTQTTA